MEFFEKTNKNKEKKSTIKSNPKTKKEKSKIQKRLVCIVSQHNQYSTAVNVNPPKKHNKPEISLRLMV